MLLAYSRDERADLSMNQKRILARLVKGELK
jgi:hypothetical protein